MQIKTFHPPRSVTADAVALVMHTLMCKEKHRFESSSKGEFERGKHTQSVVILSSLPGISQVNCLPELRKKGFCGGVLTLSSQTEQKTKDQYPILRRGQSSHRVAQLPLQITDLIRQVSDLKPMFPETLQALQQEMDAPAEILEEPVLPALERLRAQGAEVDAEVDVLRSFRSYVSERTPRANHVNVCLAGQTKSVSQHMEDILHLILNSSSLTERCRAVSAFEEICGVWKALCLQTGDALQITRRFHGCSTDPDC